MSRKFQTGGMFNSYKVKYSPETHNLLKVLMEEVKMTSFQRKQIKDSLKRGRPLPPLPKRTTRPSYVDNNLFDLKKNYYFLRRSKDQIIRSGAYERDRYKFLGEIVDIEKEKERLQNIMMHGNKLKTKTKIEKKDLNLKKPPKKEIITPDERMEELIVEVEDRLQFLQEMEAMGMAKNYEFTIKQEIASKVREMLKIDKNSGQKYSQLFHSKIKENQ